MADYFPTLDPREEPFMVLDLETLNLYNDRLGRRPGTGPNEVWAKTMDEDGAVELLTAALAGMDVSVEESLVASEENTAAGGAGPWPTPVGAACWRLMFLALVLASASGVALFSYVDTGERRTEFALLRTLGSSASQLNGMVWFNLLLMVACGGGTGHLGRPANRGYPCCRCWRCRKAGCG